MSEFEDNLWREVVREHGAELAGAPGPRHPGRWRPRPRLLAGTTVATAAVAGAVVLVLSATDSSPAYGVTRNSDGTVTVKLIRVSGVAGANRRLRDMGVRVQILPSGKGHLAAVPACGPPPGAAVRAVTVNPKRIPRARVLLLAADRAARLGYYVPAGAHAPRGDAVTVQAQVAKKLPPAALEKFLRARRRALASVHGGPPVVVGGTKIVVAPAPRAVDGSTSGGATTPSGATTTSSGATTTSSGATTTSAGTATTGAGTATTGTTPKGASQVPARVWAHCARVEKPIRPSGGGTSTGTDTGTSTGTDTFSDTGTSTTPR